MITRNFRREQKRKRVMAYFINATIELMEEIGIENLTIRKVAERAKYNSATLYNYFDGLDELEMFASVKCLNEYVKTSQIKYSEGKSMREWYLGEWRCFCEQAFRHPRIYNFLFFSPLGETNMTEIFRRYYEIFPQEKVEEIEEYEEFMANGDFYKRNQMLLTKVLQEKEYNLTDKEISELNEMSILIFRGMLETMRIDKNKPTLAQAVHRTVQYLENTLRVYHLV